LAKWILPKNTRSAIAPLPFKNSSQVVLPEDWKNGGFGLYIHWPFCQAKCPYCDFNSHVAASIDQDRWLAAYISEIRRTASETQGRVLNSVFFGGGTPSMMQPHVVGRILETIHECWPTSNSLEVTLEANPTSVEAGRFRGYLDAGVNRISMGIQALNDDDLRALGRLHSVAEARAAFDIARDTFDRISFDLIYARQNQSLEQWRRELTEAMTMAADHLSLYQLAIEDGTAFGDRFARGRLPGLPGEDAAADMYFATQEICDAAGLPAYEVSNHARDGAQSRHNLVYWRYGDYAGIGPGAHGRLTLDGQRYATDTPTQPNLWLNAVETTGTGEFARDTLSGSDQATEYLLMGLRISGGIDVTRFSGLGGTTFNSNKINQLRDNEVINFDGTILSTTDKGRPLLNAVIRELLSDVI
jgi:putative oxygen-independent coproporphyrinogen III oxidase